MASEIRACWLWYETNSTSQAVVAKISLVIEYEKSECHKNFIWMRDIYLTACIVKFFLDSAYQVDSDM